MSSSLITLPPAAPALPPAKKKRVLLVDDCAGTRDLRADAMRKLGMNVDCAGDISEARYWWKAQLYGLVIVSAANDGGHRDKFCADLRGATPPQHLVFLVGKPAYFANTPGEPTAGAELIEQTLQQESEPLQQGDPQPVEQQRWGIMEASRRISAVRSTSAARARAIRERPVPPRDRETRDSRRADVMSRLASELQREDLL
ncbi:MAG TPA: response regulator [Terriglobales bacterium]|nr:response regulator [Terriglobales bacterium]